MIICFKRVSVKTSSAGLLWHPIVFSPGHFAGPFIPESLGDGTRYIRNRVVALVARRLELIEKRGTGIRMVIDRTTALGAPARFVEGSNWFKVVLPFPVETLTPVSDPGSKVMESYRSCQGSSELSCCMRGSCEAAGETGGQSNLPGWENGIPSLSVYSLAAVQNTNFHSHSIA
jgi:hypothetical protein